jgi:hypothetical protein
MKKSELLKLVFEVNIEPIQSQEPLMTALKDLANKNYTINWEMEVPQNPALAKDLFIYGLENMKHGKINSLKQALSFVGVESPYKMLLSRFIISETKLEANSEYYSTESFKKYLPRYCLIEEVTENLSLSRNGVPLALGFLFDILISKIEMSQKEDLSAWARDNWQHSILTAKIAYSLTKSERVFSMALAHDIGKFVIPATLPLEYLKILPQLKSVANQSNTDDALEAVYELQSLPYSHVELGSFFLSHFDFLDFVEEAVDFHHEYKVLEARNTNLFNDLKVVQGADRLAFALRNGVKLDESLVQRTFGSEDLVYGLDSKKIQHALRALS